jgi:hypothetical protein
MKSHAVRLLLSLGLTVSLYSIGLADQILGPGNPLSTRMLPAQIADLFSGR